MQPFLKNQLRLRERLAIVPLYVGTVLLLVNQRVGWEDRGGPNLLAVVLRSDIWFAITIVLGLVFIPKWTLWPRGRIGIAKTVLLSAPVTFLLAALFASLLSLIDYNQAFDGFGTYDFAKSVLCIGLGLLVFNLALASSRFASTMVTLLTWTPLVNILVAIFALTTSINNIEGFNQVSTEVDVSLGFVGFGDRFQGLASNPYITMTQSSIALALLIPRILRPETGQFWLRLLLLLYAVALSTVIAWTGVRAALIVLPLVCLLAVWLHFRPTAQSLVKACLVIAQISVFFIVAWIVVSSMGFDEALVGRLGEDDGRLFLWVYYSNLLFENPFGLGFAFESIAKTDFLIAGQRLPPHNTLLQAGMYGGFAGIIISLFLLGKVGHVIARLRRSTRSGRLSNELLGVILAWFALVLTLMFSGLISAEFNFAILTALLLALAARSVTQVGQRKFYESKALR
jgi:hypothetical protein